MIPKQFPFTATDATRIASAIRTYADSIGHRINKVWFKSVDTQHVLSLILTGGVNAAIVNDSYLVLYEAGAPWYNPTVTVVEELMVLSLQDGSPTASLKDVTDFLEGQGRIHKATLVVVGTALAHRDEALIRMYGRLGFNRESTMLIKAIQ